MVRSHLHYHLAPSLSTADSCCLEREDWPKEKLLVSHAAVPLTCEPCNTGHKRQTANSVTYRNSSRTTPLL